MHIILRRVQDRLRRDTQRQKFFLVFFLEQKKVLGQGVKFGLVGLPEIHFLFVCPKEKKKALYICSENSKNAVKKKKIKKKIKK